MNETSKETLILTSNDMGTQHFNISILFSFQSQKYSNEHHFNISIYYVVILSPANITWKTQWSFAEHLWVPFDTCAYTDLIPRPPPPASKRTLHEEMVFNQTIGQFKVNVLGPAGCYDYRLIRPWWNYVFKDRPKSNNLQVQFSGPQYSSAGYVVDQFPHLSL